MAKRQPLQQFCWENWIFACRKLKLDPCFHPVQVSTQSGLRTLFSDLKPRSVQERAGNTLEAIGIGKDFLRTQAAQQLRGRMNQWNYMKLNSLFTAKEMVSKLKRPPTEWEKIFANYISDKGLITRIYRELKKLNSQKIDDPIKKWATELYRTLSNEEVQMAKKHMKKFSPFLAIKEIQNKTTLRFHLTPIRITTNTNNNKCWQDVSRKKKPHTLLVGM
jgi:hypothetical protein